MGHWTDDLGNVSDSVRQRLRNVSRETQENMQVVLIRYATERLLYRLSLSEHSERFVLKGAWLFYLWGISRRATRDVDFLASIPNQAQTVEEIFKEIVGVSVPHDDGLLFDLASFSAEAIQLDAEYSGIRLKLVAGLGRTRIQTQIDLGFSEALVEVPTKATLPVLLDFEPPLLKAYSPSVVVAEKLEAVVKLGTVTTRFKDFFDLVLLSNEARFEGDELVRQVRATFNHRGTAFPDGVPVALRDYFGQSKESQGQWAAFIRRNEAVGAPQDFSLVVSRVRDFLHPVLLAAAEENRGILQRWTPEGGWTSRASGGEATNGLGGESAPKNRGE